MAHPLNPVIDKITAMLDITNTMKVEDFSEEELKLMRSVVWDLIGVRIKLENRRAETIGHYI